MHSAATSIVDISFVLSVGPLTAPCDQMLMGNRAAEYQLVAHAAHVDAQLRLLAHAYKQDSNEAKTTQNHEATKWAERTSLAPSSNPATVSLPSALNSTISLLERPLTALLTAPMLFPRRSPSARKLGCKTMLP
jgi:hypothetical protein